MSHHESSTGRRAVAFPVGRLPLALLALAPLALVAAACGGGPEPASGGAETPPEIRATVAEARLVEVPAVTVVTGSIEPWRRVSPGTKLLGRVEEFLVREGDRVRAGQMLVRLESRDLEAAVAQARASIGMAEAQLENARAWHDRISRLHERGSATDKSLEDAVAGLRVAQAGVTQAEAALAAARVHLEYAEIKAPSAGWVAATRAEPGDIASPGMPLLVIEDLSRVKVVAQVPESDLAAVALGTPVAVSLESLGLTREGKIDAIVPAGDPGSRTFDVKIHLDNADLALRSGMFVRVSLPAGSEAVLRIPIQSLVGRGQLEGVWVLEDGVARVRWVRTGQRVGDEVEILSGLRPGDRYVVDPPANLVDGATVLGG